MNKKMVIILLHIIEIEASRIRFAISDNADYMQIRKIVSFDELSYEDKLFIRDTLRNILFPAVGLSFESVFRANFTTAIP